MNVTKWTAMPGDAVINDTVKNMEKRNIRVRVTGSRQEALDMLKEMIPVGASVMTGSSTTLNEIGLTKYLKSEDHPWKNLKNDIMTETEKGKQEELRRKSALADYFLGSVHAISNNGELVIASATGSQLPAYAYSSPHVIWVAGVQKITSDLDEALHRVREYVLPMEDDRMKEEGQQGSFIGKILIFEKEANPGRMTMILAKEKLGF